MDSIKRVVIPPHGGIYAFVNFKIKKIPDSAFNLKIGLKMMPWHEGLAKAVLAEIAHEKPDTCWSNTKMIKIKGDWQKQDSVAEEQYKAGILEKVTPIFLPRITDEDKNNYTISVNQTKIKRLTIPNDTIIKCVYFQSERKKKCNYFICETTIRNNSKDTLKYVSVSCSWLDFYRTNDVDLKILEPMCFRNVPEDHAIPPQHSSIVEIPIVVDVKTKLPRKLKIGLCMQKCTDCNPYEMASDLLDMALKPQSYNTLWSNEVTIK